MGRHRIGLDARMLEQTQTGLGRYAAALASELPPLDPSIDFVVILRPGVDARDLERHSNVEIVRLPGWLDAPSNLLRGRSIEKLRLDVYHALHHFLPFGLGRARVVMTLHDLIWVEHAHLAFDGRSAWIKHRAVGAYGRFTMRQGMRRADHVIAISQHSADRAQRRYGLTESRFTVIHHGVSHARFSTAEHDDQRDDTVPASPFLLSLGNSKPYKNVRILLQAFALLAPRHPSLRLAIAGRGDARSPLEALARRLDISSRVDFVGMISHGTLVRLLRRAEALVFPSLIEGFGFPPIEAMAAGCPVVTSEIPVMREIVGDAALRADPRHAPTLAITIERVLMDQGLKQQLRDRGHARAADFQWNRAATDTLGVYHRMLGSA